ncbi:hypothetical protein [Flavobacterium litorale]|uniref:Uncharacterized protein n=1 Tax=Flavobacterium litorale TaxID=2856519 RepID=A0ABX8V688_9FLAO|nr:hypothetical protein [Flavobacterium litorale]QYJ68330.1 hypothetical protein K1I41_00115 [Flavobacterium litorale]
MATNEQLTQSAFTDLGLFPPNRRPYAKEIFKLYDIDLLPHASEQTLIGEVFEWSGRTFRSSGDNIIGIIAPPARVTVIKERLENIVPANASVPDFEFSKEEIVGFGLKLPFLFNIGFSGNVNNATNLSVKVNSLKKARLTNIEEPGIEIKHLLAEFEDSNPRDYRRRIKNDWITEALFYADSVEIDLEKQSGVDIDVSFDVHNVAVEASLDTDTKKRYVLKYSGGNAIPFGATFKKGKHLFE